MTKQRSFASLTEEEINQVAEWLQHGTSDEVRDRIPKPRPEGFGIKVSRSPLQRLWAKTARVERILFLLWQPTQPCLKCQNLEIT